MDSGEVFMAGVIELFEHYPLDIVAKAASPVFGLPSKYKFMPRIAEIKEWLDAELPPPKPKYLISEPEPDRSNRPTYEELIERCARDGLIIGKKKKPFGEREIAEFKKAHNVSEELWNSIPDAK